MDIYVRFLIYHCVFSFTFERRKIVENVTDSLNQFMLNIFNDIIKIEQDTLKKAGFTDVSTSEAHTVEVIGLYLPKSMSAVADKLNITVGTLTVAVNNLVRKGYVERKRSEKDKRVVMLSLTQKGKELYKAYQRFHNEVIGSAVLGLSDHEATVFVDALSNIRSNLVNKYNSLKQGEKYV